VTIDVRSAVDVSIKALPVLVSTRRVEFSKRRKALPNEAKSLFLRRFSASALLWRHTVRGSSKAHTERENVDDPPTEAGVANSSTDPSIPWQRELLIGFLGPRQRHDGSGYCSKP
jgi:hypothetical protein